MQKLYAARLKTAVSTLALCSPPSSPIYAFTRERAQAAIIASALLLGIARHENGNIVLVQ